MKRRMKLLTVLPLAAVLVAMVLLGLAGRHGKDKPADPLPPVSNGEVEPGGQEQPGQDDPVEDPAETGREAIPADVERTGDYLYYIKVNDEANVVTVYAADESGHYTVPYRAMLCSTGSATPTSGVFALPGNRWIWKSLFGDVYGQYATHITGDILFHSVPYARNEDKGSLKYEEYDKLGTSCSMGCVRLQVADAQWIYDNMFFIQAVEFYESPAPGPLGRPEVPGISDNVTCRDWDPTDPDENNPWRKHSANG